MGNGIRCYHTEYPIYFTRQLDFIRPYSMI
jgi:hypothetical protein